MKRFVQVAGAACVLALGCAGQAAAQPKGDRPISVEVNAGAAFGSQSSSAFGVEGDYAISQKITAFVDLAMIGNVAPSFVTDRANIVGTALGGSADVKDKATFGAIGVKYTLMPVSATYRPYVGVGYTFGKIAKTSSFTIGGTSVNEDQLLANYGVQLGSDLAGSITKKGVGVLVGVTRAFGERLGVDLSYRFNRFGAKTDLIEGDEAINAQRLVIGVLYRF